MLQNFRAAYVNTGLRFLLMFLGVVIVPVIVFVNAGGDASPQNSANLFWQYLILGGLLFAALLFGWALFKREARGLSISTPPAGKSTVDQGVN